MIKWCNSQTLNAEATNLMKSVSSVLDIGCGIRPQQYIVPSFLICVEPHLEYVEILKRNLKDVNAIIIPLDAKTVLSALPSRSIDSVFLIDVIEHMPKDVGAGVIRECERVARQQVVLFTPLGFMPQEIHAGDADGWNLHGGDWQDHKSGWHPDDFPGWDIVACKHLHFSNFKRQPITPPYGGFYAIKNIPNNANYFNDIYSKDVLQNSTSNLNWISENFPLFIEQVVYRNIENSMLKCGIRACQRTTELFIEIGNTKTFDEICELAEREKSNALLKEMRMHNDSMRVFADQFLEFNAREAELSARSVEMAEREAWIVEQASIWAKHEPELKQREASLAEKEFLLAAREAGLNHREVQLNSKEAIRSDQEASLIIQVQEPSNTLCGKVNKSQSLI